MAVYSRQTSSSSLPPSTNTSSLLPSQDLGSIIVRSLEESLQNMDDNSDNLTAQIREGINTSILGKNNNSNPIKQEQELQKLKKKNEEENDRRRKTALKKMSDDYEKSFKKFQSNLEGTFDKAFKGLTTFTDNPLQAFDKGLQSIIKGTLGTVDKIANTPIFGKKENSDKAPELATVNSSMSSIEALLNQIQANTDKTVKSDDKKDEQDTKDKRKRDDKEKEEKKEGIVREKKRHEDSEKINQGVATTNLTLGTIGKAISSIVLGVVAFMAFLPILRGWGANLLLWARETVTHFFSMIPTHLKNAMNTLGMVFENGILEIKKQFLPIIRSIGATVIKILHPLDEEKRNEALAEFYGVSKEEYAQYAGNKKAAEDYQNYLAQKERSKTLPAEKKALQEKMNAFLESRGLDMWQMYAVETGEPGGENVSSEDYREWSKMRDAIEAINQQQSTDQRFVSKFLKTKYTVDGQTYTGNDFVNYQPEGLQKASETAAKLGGDIDSQIQLLEEQQKANKERVEAENKAALEQGNWDYRLSQMTASEAQQVLATGTWKDKNYSKNGTIYQLTDEQRRQLKAKTEFRQLGTLEKDAAIGGAFGTGWGNLFGGTMHDVFGFKYQQQNPNTQTVGNTPVFITNVIDGTGTGLATSR